MDHLFFISGMGETVLLDWILDDGTWVDDNGWRDDETWNDGD